MKKIILFVLIILFFVSNVYADGYDPALKTLDFADYIRNPKAEKILYEYYLKNDGVTKERAKNQFNISLDTTYAYEFDLNGDGVNEIIGFYASTLFLGTAGFSIYILKKTPKGYENIIGDAVNFEPQINVYVLKNRTNGYHDIQLNGSTFYNFRSFILKYDNGQYHYAQNIKRNNK